MKGKVGIGRSYLFYILQKLIMYLVNYISSIEFNSSFIPEKDILLNSFHRASAYIIHIDIDEAVAFSYFPSGNTDQIIAVQAI